jgi:hypothetical protein
MESQQNEAAIKPILVRISHPQYQELLQSAWDADQKYRWLRQFEFVVSLAVVDDSGVMLKLP